MAVSANPVWRFPLLQFGAFRQSSLYSPLSTSVYLRVIVFQNVAFQLNFVNAVMKFGGNTPFFLLQDVNGGQALSNSFLLPAAEIGFLKPLV